MKDGNFEMIDDTELSIPLYSSVCTFCKHWHCRPGRTCQAFPNGIPLKIWNGVHDHKTSFDDDNGILFEPVEKKGG